MYRDHRKGPGGPPGGATCPGGPRGLKVEGNQPLMGWGATLGLPPMRLGLGTLGGGVSPCLGGQGNPPGRRPLLRLDLRGPAPLSLAPINRGEVGGQPHHIQGAALPLPNTSSSSREAWRSPAGVPRCSNTTTLSCCCWSCLPQPLPRHSAVSRVRGTSPSRTCAERGGAVVTVLGSVGS